MAFTNYGDVPLSLALWLAHDSYDHDANVVSVTKFIKPLRELILASRVDPSKVIVADQDVLDMLKSRMGTAIHNSIECTWKMDNIAPTLELLGIPPKVRGRIKVNPTDKELKEDNTIIPMYSEITMFKLLDDIEFRGTADFILKGRLQDFKTTSTYSFLNKHKDKKYSLQGSIYRWIDPNKITEDSMDILEVYWDWQKMKALTSTAGSYPPSPVTVKKIPLLSISETDRFIRNKIKLIDKYWDAPQSEIPLCEDEDLWRKDSTFKYYSDPTKMARSTKNFPTENEAYAFMSEKGKGIVVEQKAGVTACKFCSAFPVCEQAKDLIERGELILNG